MSSAAKALGTNVATVSRRIDRLTLAMGETLFIKQDRSWEPTTTCKALIDVARGTETQISGVESLVHSEPPAGAVLRLTCDLTVLQTGSMRRLSSFLDQYTDLGIDLMFKPKSLAYAETDIAVGYEEPEEGRIVRKRIGQLHVRPFVWAGHTGTAGGWISIRYGVRQHATDGVLFDAFGFGAKAWVEGLNLAVTMMRETAYVAMLPEEFAAGIPELVPWENDAPPVSLPIWVSYHSSRRLDPLIRVGLDLVDACLLPS